MNQALTVFAYGTLIFPEVVEIVVGRRPPKWDALLPGYRRARLDGRVYPGIVEEPGRYLVRASPEARYVFPPREVRILPGERKEVDIAVRQNY